MLLLIARELLKFVKDKVKTIKLFIDKRLIIEISYDPFVKKN